MVEVVPVVLGSVTKDFDGWIEMLLVTNVRVIQKTALLGTARISRKVLEV